jgi:hypothetical protein
MSAIYRLTIDKLVEINLDENNARASNDSRW